MEKLEQIIQNLGFESVFEFANIRLRGHLQNYLADILPFSTENQFQNILDSLEPLKKGSYTAKNSLDSTQKNTIWEVIQKFSGSFENFLQNEIIHYVEQKIYEKKLLILFFENKYQTKNFEIVPQNNYGILEQEDDLMVWERTHEEIHFFESLKISMI